MIEGLENALANTDERGLPALRSVLGDLLSERQAKGSLVEEEILKHRVYRLRFSIQGAPVNIVAKRLDPDIAWRNRLVVERWLPALDLTTLSPALLATAAEPGGQSTWLIYEDLGGASLETLHADKASVMAAVQAIALLHNCFFEHPLLGEGRLWGGDLGMYFYSSNIRDAQRALEAVKKAALPLQAGQMALLDRLLARLGQLEAQAPQRADLLETVGGPETLLHGDLWTQNIFISPEKDGYQVKFIDWDHVAVGPISYDLSTFLWRFPQQERGWIVEAYLAAAQLPKWIRPTVAEWNQLFETAELARITNRLIWPALAILEGDIAWAFDALNEIESWYLKLKPALPETADPAGHQAQPSFRQPPVVPQPVAVVAQREERPDD